MIKKLRRKLVAISMISMLLVLFTVVSVINILNFCGIVDDADFILSVLASNDGTFPVIEKGNSGADRNEFESMPDNNIPKKNQSDIIVFLDCSNSLSTCKTFLFTSGIISFAGALAVFLLILIFSGRIVKPVSESYEKQKQFITDAGHEIKTPITIIDADAEVLAMDLGENEWLSDIRKQTKRLSILTNDLIYLSRMEERKAPLSVIEFPISDIT